jgi:hypothetical protein
LIERNIRFQKSKFVSLGLLFILVLIGVTGYIVKTKNGYPNRFNIEKKWNEGELGNQVFKQQGLVAQRSCIDSYQNLFEKPKNRETLLDYEFCLIQNNKKEPTALLFGDSHANNLYSGLVTNIDLTHGNLLNLGRGACYPFVDLFFQEDECKKLVNNALKLTVSNISIKTVIIASRTFQQKDIPIFKKIFSLHKDTEEDFYKNIQEGMRKTLEQLQDANKEIIVILDTPVLNFSPEQCMMRPWRLSGDLFKNPCAIARSEVDSKRKKYLAIIMDVLKEFPSVQILDPLPAFCDETYCWAIKKEKMLYRDKGHLSKIGSIYLGEYFKNQK